MKARFLVKLTFVLYFLLLASCSTEKKESFEATTTPVLHNTILASGKCTNFLLEDIQLIEVDQDNAVLIQACRRFQKRHLPNIQCEVPANSFTLQPSSLKWIQTSDYHNLCRPILANAGPESFMNIPQTSISACTTSFAVLYERMEKWGTSTLACKELREVYSKAYRCQDSRLRLLKAADLYKLCGN